jgi:hypothetical protein
MFGSGCQEAPQSRTILRMNKISGPGQFRVDAAKPLTQSVMIVDAVARASGDGSGGKCINLCIHEKLPLVQGPGGAEAEIQLSPDQASRLAHLLFEIVGQTGPVSPAMPKPQLAPTA